MLFVVGVVVVLFIYIYVNDYKNDYKPDYKLQCAVPSQYLYVNDYKHDYNPNYKPNYKLQCIFSSQYRHLMRKPMMFSIIILTCNVMMLCQRWYNITGGFSTCDTGFHHTQAARLRILVIEMLFFWNPSSCIFFLFKFLYCACGKVVPKTAGTMRLCLILY